MGMRSDLSKEIKHLLGSDIIKGKVSVQRAYADWRRYPQYIVPLSEASVDLIFAPAYGSSKKNATDIRMAIDAVELVFIRPEIGTFILLTGDSDFSSLVLKLKEYGKYVIGVGIQESTSDILVQNCDEYYSYTSLTGLSKTTGTDQKPSDPWVLVTQAVKRMADRGDVMRSDRLKQVMIELDPSFEEGSFGFSKFSKFLAEASSRNLVRLRKLDNGQYEVSPVRGGRRSREEPAGRGRREREEERTRPRRTDRGRGRRDRRPAEASDEEMAGGRAATLASGQAEAEAIQGGEDPLREAYGLLVRALKELRAAGRELVRDSDVKRKMLELRASFDEAELGFPKFSRFLRQAHDHEVVTVRKGDGGNYEVSLPERAAAPEEEALASVETGVEASVSGAEEEAGPPEAAPPPDASESGSPAAVGRRRADGSRREAADSAQAAEPATPTVVEIGPADLGEQGQYRLGPRRGSTRRRGGEGPPPPFEGQVAGVVAASDAAFDAAALGLPTSRDAIVRYLANRYKGVGDRTAELLVERFGTDLFRVLRDDPAAIESVVTPKRAEQVLAAWATDYARRTASGSDDAAQAGGRGGR